MSEEDFDEDVSEKDLTVDPNKRKSRNDRFSGKDKDSMKRNWYQADRANIASKELAFSPPTKTSAECLVCQSEYRLFIERQIVKGKSYSAIARSVPPNPDGRPVSRKSVANHAQVHMALDDAAVRAILEEEAELANQNYQEGVKGALTWRGMSEVAIRKAFEDILTGVTTVEPKDMVQFIRLMREMDENASATAIEEARMQIALFMSAIRDVCDANTQDQIAQRVRELRERDSIEKAVEEHLLPSQTVEAELIDDDEE